MTVVYGEPRDFRAAAKLRAFATKTDRKILVCGLLLFLLLVFVTCTVFVRQTWPLEAFQIGIFLVVAGTLVWEIRRGPERNTAGLVTWCACALPAWGVLQIAAHTTVSTLETRMEVLKWASLAGVFFLAQTIGSTRRARRIATDTFLAFATAMAVLCLTQLFTSKGLVLWLFPSGYPDVFGTFQNRNNFAQFAELAFPIAVWRFLSEGWKSWWYCLAGGILFASVIASASRAGTIAMVVELLVILIISLTRKQEGGRRRSIAASALAGIPTIAIIFTLVVGWQQVWERFKINDPYFVRREFIASAIAEVRHRPLTGFGLGTFPEVYQRFAVKDFPFYANHTHCDWAEFAADGGIPFLLLVLALFGPAVPTAFRRPWGLGIPVVMVHALVDYPFPRPAVSAWMFALLAFLYMERRSNSTESVGTIRSPISEGGFRRFVPPALRIGFVAVCCLGVWLSFRLILAAWLFQQDTPDSIRAAIRVVPDVPTFYLRLAQMDGTNARSLLETALELNPYNAQANIELALSYEEDGDLHRAEQLLLNAYAVDHTYLPRWSLANFYFRHDNMTEFWKWARRAAEMPSDNVGPLFALCWRVAPDPSTISRAILTDNPDLIRQFIAFLVARKQLQPAGSVALQLVQYGNPEDDLEPLFSLLYQLVTAEDSSEAQAIWKAMADKHWVQADLTVPNNPGFLRTPLEVVFDWVLHATPGVRSVTGPDGLQIEFSGDEPEECIIMDQIVVLHPGNYTLSYSYRLTGIDPGAGIQWEIQGMDDQSPLVTSSGFSSPGPTTTSAGFSVSAPSGLYHLRLVYRRALGTTRIAGTLGITSVRIAPRQDR